MFLKGWKKIKVLCLEKGVAINIIIFTKLGMKNAHICLNNFVLYLSCIKFKTKVKASLNKITKKEQFKC